MSLRLAYADPPYPGRAHLYETHPDYAGEVDHRTLITDTLDNYDGWALSTNAESLRWILPLCPKRSRVLAWVKNTVTVAWEPVIVVSARKPDSGLRDWVHSEADSYQWRAKPDSYVIGQKPERFCIWLFEWLGAQPDDSFDDLFPGSGQVSKVWERWSSQLTLPLGRSQSAEGRAQRREKKKMLSAHPTLGDSQ